MKILVATGIYPPDIGGPATYSKLLFDELPKRGIQVSVLSFGSVRHLPKIIRHIMFGVKLLKASRGVSIIFAQDTVSVGFPSLLVSKIFKKKLFVRVPGDHAWEQSTQRYGVKESIDDFQTKKYKIQVEILRSVQRFVVSHAHTVIAPSVYFRDLVSKWTPHPERVHCIYNGINLDEIKPSEQFESKTIFSAGRLVPWKGFSELIDMMQQLPEWRLAIAGEGPQRKELEEKIKNNNLASRVTLLGQIDRPQLLKKLTNSEVFVLNTTFESFSFQIVEAMAAGVPVITTRVGNLAEIVDDSVNGFLVQPNSPEIVEKIKMLHADLLLRTKIIEEAKHKAKNFSIQQTVDKVANMLV